jgi:hypothetical protein
VLRRGEGEGGVIGGGGREYSIVESRISTRIDPLQNGIIEEIVFDYVYC